MAGHGTAVVAERATTSAAPVASSAVSAPAATSSRKADTECKNTAFTRQCWGGGFSIATDYDTAWPNTGNTVYADMIKYNFEVTNTTMAPDGFSRLMMVVNGQYPGPTVFANWGDTISITVKNSLQNNGATMDGTNGITECPIPPGGSKTYTFLATQFGTSWYHSHFSSQYGEGVLGPIVIHGPATSNYDVDLGAMPVTDWCPPPVADNGLINGTMVGTSGTGGRYHKNTIVKGKKYRLRLINTSLDNSFRVSLDGHNLTVIQADFVPTKPYTAQTIFIGIGAPSSNPTSSSWNIPDNCADEQGLTPYVVKNVPSATFAKEWKELDVMASVGASVNGLGGSVVQWTMNTSAIDISWTDPTLRYVVNNDNTYYRDGNVIQLPTADKLYFWVFKSLPGLAVTPHPIHLHGHDFYLLGAGNGDFTDPAALQWNNPPRRDVAMLPAGGYLVIGFEANNPGAWLMHCHIAFHVAQGLSVQFLERQQDIQKVMSLGNVNSECDAWDKYDKTAVYKKEDSGL
ncbi:putative Laccase-3 [Glarea lozoyensis 74030]|uniref:laccase n=1 Tax=Glarea lozoyensis (strain ATCC 74030 / MF5533) TaxID=1104152 RepID=H0ET20_GLAL7|nr:putative Laccase-3 [Glarea lozoyensis 74030]